MKVSSVAGLCCANSFGQSGNNENNIKKRKSSFSVIPISVSLAVGAAGGFAANKALTYTDRNKKNKYVQGIGIAMAVLTFLLSLQMKHYTEKNRKAMLERSA